MAGYSGTPLAQKLGIKSGHRVVVLAAPPSFAGTLSIPDDVKLAVRLPAKTASVDVILLFVPDAKTLIARFDACRAALVDDGGLWVCWPKKASKIAIDVTEDVVRAHALARGLVDNKVCAVDDVYSGLRCVVRVKDRVTKRPRR
jgi:hypothetical protein